MDRETKTITLPVSEIKVDIITYWTFREYKQIESLSYKAAKSIRQDSDNKNVVDIDATVMIDADIHAMVLAIKKMVDKEGKELPVNEQTIGDLHMEDGTVLRSYIDLVGKDDKKK